MKKSKQTQHNNFYDQIRLNNYENKHNKNFNNYQLIYGWLIIILYGIIMLGDDDDKYGSCLQI